jgi:hypothetical protein
MLTPDAAGSPRSFFSVNFDLDPLGKGLIPVGFAS